MASPQNLIPTPELQFLDVNGNPLAGGLVYTYAGDGATPKATFLTAVGTNANSNPVVLDAAGRGIFWGTGTYVFGVYDSLGNQVYTQATQDPTVELGATPFGLELLQLPNLAALEALVAPTGPTKPDVPWGTLLPFTGPAAPGGWVFCVGQLTSRTQYPNVFAAIGTTWGAGDGSTTFHLPDTRGRAMFGVDAGAGVLTQASLGAGSVSFLGFYCGSELAAKDTITAVVHDPGHEHTYTPAIGASSSGSGAFGGSNIGYISQLGTVNAASTGITVTASGNNTGLSQNLPPAMQVNWIMQLG